MKLKGLKLIALFMSLSSVGMFATQIGTVSSPDGELVVKVVLDEGKPAYSVEYKGAVVLENSPLGFTTNEGDFSSNLKFVDSATDRVAKQYTQDRIKKSEISYEANSLKQLLLMQRTGRFLYCFRSATTTLPSGMNLKSGVIPELVLFKRKLLASAFLREQPAIYHQ